MGERWSWWRRTVAPAAPPVELSGGHTPARRTGPRPGRSTLPSCSGRAALLARPQAARAAPGRCSAVAPARHHRRLRHPRPGRGAGDVGPGGGHADGGVERCARRGRSRKRGDGLRRRHRRDSTWPGVGRAQQPSGSRNSPLVHAPVPEVAAGGTMSSFSVQPEKLSMRQLATALASVTDRAPARLPGPRGAADHRAARRARSSSRSAGRGPRTVRATAENCFSACASAGSPARPGAALMLQNFIGGAFAPALDGASEPVLDPATGERHADAARSGAADVDAAVAAAVRAAEGWAATTPGSVSGACWRSPTGSRRTPTASPASRPRTPASRSRPWPPTSCRRSSTACASSPGWRARSTPPPRASTSRATPRGSGASRSASSARSRPGTTR